MLFKVATSLAALLALFVYRNGRVAWNHFLTAPALPDAYYAGGNWTTHCTLIHDPASSDINFCEDITFWDHRDAEGSLTDRLVLIGCDPNRKAWNTVMGPLRDPTPRGHLFLYAPSTGTLQRLSLAGYPTTHDFHPLGMDVTPSYAGGPSTLFIVNHARAETTIEQFVLRPSEPGEAHHVRTLRSPTFVSPNAIAATSATHFFVSNDHAMTRRRPGWVGRVAPVVESLGALPLGWLAHVTVHEAPAPLSHTNPARGIPFANGVALSPSHTHLAIAATSMGCVYVYTVDALAPPTLVFSHAIPVPFLPDNIVYDDEGTLIVTGHPHFPALVRVAANDTSAIAPSWVVAIKRPMGSNETSTDTSTGDARAPLSAAEFVPGAVTTYGMETLFQSDGSVFGSSSTTLRDARTDAIYISGLYERGILVCRPQHGSVLGHHGTGEERK